MLDPYERIAKEGSLTAALAAVWKELNGIFDPATRAAFEQLFEWLRSGAIGASAIRVGDQLPEFILPDQDGRLVSSVDLLNRGPLLLSFFRGGWCPFCTLEMASIEQARAELETAGLQVIGVMPDAFDFPALIRESNRLGFPLLSDIDNGLALILGLAFRMPEGMIETLRRRGLNLAARHGNDSWILPIPGTLLVDQSGVVRYAFIDPDYRLRLEPRELIEAFRRL